MVSAFHDIHHKKQTSVYDMNRRILLVDDSEAIHNDYREILAPPRPALASEAKAALLGTTSTPRPHTEFEITSAFQGQEALVLVEESIAQGKPFAMAFVDVRMPPGWDGMETLEEIWKIDSTLQAVICTAFSDYTWDEMVGRIGDVDRLLILRKPFDNIEVRQLAAALCRKWELEREAKLKVEELAALVNSRTREIANARDHLLIMNKQLEVSRTAAEEASTAKSAFLANISHEIRTPMNAILGYADYLFQEGDIHLAPDDRVQAIDTIRRNGTHLLQLINDLLDISKIEANKLTVERIECHPLDVVDEVIDLMHVRAREQGLELTREIVDAIPVAIESDPTRLRQILVNLVGNAIKFTERGGVTVRLELVPGEDGKQKLRIKVIDTGIGLAPQQIQKLFQPFTQADDSTTRRYGGTGLGLSICHRLCETLGGTISVESELGRGSTFCVTIDPGSIHAVPMIRQQGEEVEAPVPIEETTTELFGCRVLLAEDGIDNERLFVHLLKKAGAEVTSVENGQLACEAYQASQLDASPFDLILMDMQMPVLDGYEATRRLRQDGCQLPIVAMTAHAMEGDRDKCLAAGCTHYVTKPLTRKTLLETVDRFSRVAESV